jgi:NTP pyrophosphatase (non-canonical NTP hydrolase)
MTIDLNKYSDFVYEVTSTASKDLTDFMNRLDQLDGNDGGPDINVPLLITACFGLAAESGEFVEIPKKILFQGKPLTDAEVFHLKRELGDVIFYWINACRSLNLDPNEVIQENITKLSARYPNGFEVIRSEKREVGDI